MSAVTRGDFIAGGVLGGILKRLERLERQQRQPSGEQLSPNYLQIDPQTGRVSAKFSGSVSAQGIDFVAGSNTTPPQSNQIQWQRQSDGALVASGTGWVYPVNGVQQSAAQLASEAIGPGDTSAAYLDAVDDTGYIQTRLYVEQGARGASSAVGFSLPNDFSGLIMDGTGKSSFLQLLQNAKLRLALGTQVVTWAAGTNSNLVTVTHGLGVAPQIILVTPINCPAFGNIPVPNPNTPTANTFGLNAEVKSNFSAYPATITFGWAAIG